LEREVKKQREWICSEQRGCQVCRTLIHLIILMILENNDIPTEMCLDEIVDSSRYGACSIRSAMENNLKTQHIRKVKRLRIDMDVLIA